MVKIAARRCIRVVLHGLVETLDCGIKDCANSLSYFCLFRKCVCADLLSAGVQLHVYGFVHISLGKLDGEDWPVKRRLLPAILYVLVGNIFSLIMLIELSELVSASIHDVKNRIWFVEQQMKQEAQQQPHLQGIAEELSRLSEELALVLLAQRSGAGTLYPCYEEVWLDEWVWNCKPASQTAIVLEWDVRVRQAFLIRNMIQVAIPS